MTCRTDCSLCLRAKLFQEQRIIGEGQIILHVSPKVFLHFQPYSTVGGRKPKMNYASVHIHICLDIEYCMHSSPLISESMR